MTLDEQGNVIEAAVRAGVRPLCWVLPAEPAPAPPSRQPAEKGEGEAADAASDLPGNQNRARVEAKEKEKVRREAALAARR